MVTSYATEQNFLKIARDLDFDSLDYDKVLKQRSKSTFAIMGMGASFIIVGLAFLIGGFFTSDPIVEHSSVIFLFITGLLFFFWAAHHQRKLETIITYEILQRIKTIEGHEGFLWRISNSLNACCQEEYGGIPNEVLQLETSSQAGGIEADEIRLYKDFLEKVVQWNEKQQQEQE